VCPKPPANNAFAADRTILVFIGVGCAFVTHFQAEVCAAAEMRALGGREQSFFLSGTWTARGFSGPGTGGSVGSRPGVVLRRAPQTVAVGGA